MDGRDPLSDQDATAREHRNELACVGIQSEENDPDLRCQVLNESDDGVEIRRYQKNPTTTPILKTEPQNIPDSAIVTESAAKILRFYTASVGFRPFADRRKSAYSVE